MKKIAFVCNWGQNPDQLLKRYLKQTPKNSGRWNNLVGVSELKDADFFVIQDGIPVHLKSQVPLERSIFIKREPPHISSLPPNFNVSRVFKSFNYPSYLVDFLPAAWWVEKPYDELLALPYPHKSKKISCITTNKYSRRSQFINSYVHKYPKELDVFGRWNYTHLPDFKNSKSYKGELNYNGNCKFNGLSSYQYTLALENGSIKNYWTEKLVDAFLSWSLPIYWGCSNVFDFFPEKSLHSIDITKSDVCEKVHEIIKASPSREEIEAIEYSREKILKTYNLWAVIEKLLEEN
jgi:hypothetical protein